MKLKIFAKPKAKRTVLLKIEGGVLHIAIHAKPADGEANKELIRFLATLLDIPKSQIMLEKGDASRHKIVSVPLNDKVKALFTTSN